MIFMLSAIKAIIFFIPKFIMGVGLFSMKSVVFFVFFSVLISCSPQSQECKYLQSMGKKGYDTDNQKIKELNIKISQCPKQAGSFMPVIDPECKANLLKEFKEQNNCNK